MRDAQEVLRGPFDARTHKETFPGYFEAMERQDAAEGMRAYRAACEVRDKAEDNYQVAWRAVNADVYALARAMNREGWGTYQRAIERVESYYRECYRERFGVKQPEARRGGPLLLPEIFSSFLFTKPKP